MVDALDLALLSIYRAARGLPSPAFKDEVLMAVHAHLPFDTAGWGTFAITPQGAHVHSVHLVGLPMQMMVDYEAVKQHDTLSARALARPGTTINVSVDRSRWPLHAAMVAHVRKWGLDHALGTVNLDPALNLCNAVSLYRRAASPAFTARERGFKQRLMVHLVEAWNLNALMFVERPQSVVASAGRAWALADQQGMIYNGEAGLSALLRTEFPAWMGPRLPEPLALALAPRPSSTQPLAPSLPFYVGQQIVATIERELDDGMRLVRIRPLGHADRLSVRERVVARHFADGLTHKEIARQLGVTPSTVRNQLQAVYQKLGVRSKLALRHVLQELGLPP